MNPRRLPRRVVDAATCEGWSRRQSSPREPFFHSSSSFRRSTRMGALVSALPCVPARETVEEEEKPSAETVNEDEDPALATLDAYLALEERRRAARRTTSSSSRGRREERVVDRVESVATSTLDAYDSGAVEIAACRLRSARVMREEERDARRAFERETGEARLKALDSRASELRTGEKERFAVALYCRHAGQSGGGEGDGRGGVGGEGDGRGRVTDGGRAVTESSKWIGLGRRACEPCCERDANLLPLWGKEEFREVALARSLICAPKWTVPNGTEASSTKFHLVLSELPSSTQVAAVKDSDVKRALEERNDLDSVKGRMLGDAKFTLLDLLSSLDRRLDVVVTNTDAHGGVAVPVAEITLALTPPEVSRAWNAHRTGGVDSQIGHLREACASSVLSFEALFDQYENHLLDSNAIASVEHHRRRQARINSSKLAKDLTAAVGGSTRRHHQNYRLAGLEDAIPSDAVALASTPPNSRARPIRNANRRRRTDVDFHDDRVRA